MLNLLAQNVNGILGYGVSNTGTVKLNWIGELIRILIEGIGNVGVGIIVFTLILKTIVLPLDIYSRIKGKKQALIMERMRPQMEKLQKQYANDKNMYNQKVMELQKKSGYSMFGACLPMIVSLVIFIVVFNAFSTYSQYANLQNYKDMVDVYNGVVQSYVITGEEDENSSEKFLYALDGDGKVIYTVDGATDYTVNYENFAEHLRNVKGEGWTTLTDDQTFEKYAEEYIGGHGGYDGSFSKEIVNQYEGSELTATAKGVRNSLVSYYLEGPAAHEVKLFYEGGNDKYEKSHNNGFLWVKNLWYPDSTLNKEIPSFEKFQTTITKASISDADEEAYNKVTAELGEQKGKYNGYFILIVLSIGFMLLQQWLSMRANKSVNELSTVDGSGARTNKWMMIMMPIIYGIFSFFYSASFSLYMITNTIYGIVTMLIINKAVDVWFKKKEESGELEEILTRKANRKSKVKRSGRR